jgi:uncharacterized protein
LRAAEPLPVFTATLTVGKQSRFVLVDTRGKASSFIGLGESFAGYTLKNYDPKTATLDLARDGKISRVTLLTDTIANSSATSTPATLADAQAVLDAMNFEVVTEKTMAGMRKSQASMVESMLGQLGALGPDKDAMIAFQKKMLDEITGPVSEMRSDMAKAYSEVFTKEELQSLAIFYASPNGRSFAEKSPLLTEKMSEIAAPRMTAAMPKIQQMTQDFMMEQMAKIHTTQAGGVTTETGPATSPPAPKQ